MADQERLRVLEAGGPCQAGGGGGQGRHGRSPQGGRRTSPAEARSGSSEIRDPGRQGGKEVGRGSGARVRARACVRGSAVGARIQVDATRVGVAARESAWRRPDLCVGVPVGGLA